MRAALPMYDRPETLDATNRYWGLIRDGLRAGGLDAPDELTRDVDPWALWLAPDLLLAQTCGLPFRSRLHDKVQLVGTPDFGLPGCAPGYYNSVLITRGPLADCPIKTLLEKRVIINEGLSQSGWAALVGYAESLNLRPTRPMLSGGHENSALAVAENRADLAAIDIQTWRLLKRYKRWTTGLVEVAHTTPTPALPYIAAPGVDVDIVGQAVARAIAVLTDTDRAALGLHALINIPAQDYLAHPLPPTPGEMTEYMGKPTANLA